MATYRVDPQCGGGGGGTGAVETPGHAEKNALQIECIHTYIHTLFVPRGLFGIKIH